MIHLFGFSWRSRKVSPGGGPGVVTVGEIARLTAKVKQDGYVVFKFLPKDCRVKFGDTFVLGGFATAEELGLAGEGPVLLMITPTPG